MQLRRARLHGLQVKDGAWKEGEGSEKQQRDRDDGRKNYDDDSKIGCNIVSAGSAGELQRRVVVATSNRGEGTGDAVGQRH
ncbi:hypothetical protein BHM03_00043678 [Ensete ventricosum]|nr:hypothetical protein BHM03_00043678 [Ensete ventricosum]